MPNPNALKSWQNWPSLLLVGVLVAAFLSFDLVRSYHRELEFARRNNENIARVLDEHLVATIAKIDIALDGAVAEFGPAFARRAPEAVNGRLRDILGRIPESQSLRIVNAAGDVVFDASGKPPAGNVADRAYFVRNRDDPAAGLVISEPILARFTNNWVITLSRQIRDGDGRFLGLIQAAVRADYFMDFYQTLNLGSQGLITLLNQDLLLFARRPRLAEKLGQPLVGSEVGRQMAQGRSVGHYLSASAFDGVERVSYFRHASADRPFVIIVGTAQADVFAEIRWKIAVYALFMALLLGAIYFIVSGWRHRHRDAQVLAERMTEALRRQTHQLELSNADLTVAKEAAEAANRAKTTFLDNMSHELRTPLHAIAGISAILRRKIDDPKHRDKLEKIGQAADRLAGVLNQVLELSRLEADRLLLEQAAFRLGNVADSLSGLFAEPAREKGLDFAVAMDQRLTDLMVVGDELRLRQIIANLVANALKYTDQGFVRVHAAVAEDEDDAVVARFAVQDSGIGMDPAALGQLFTPFQQVDASTTRRHGGSGLGLAISRRLAALMGGAIEVTSTPGAGSTFVLSIRLARAGAA